MLLRVYSASHTAHRRLLLAPVQSPQQLLENASYVVLFRGSFSASKSSLNFEIIVGQDLDHSTELFKSLLKRIICHHERVDGLEHLVTLRLFLHLFLSINS